MKYKVKINSVSKLTVTGGTECSSDGREHYKCEVAGSNPAFPNPMNCNHWKISFPCFGFQYSTLGGKLRFNSVYWNFLLREGL